jgi:hypothetical protein
MALVECIPCVKMSGQGITFYNEVHLYSEQTGNEIPRCLGHDRPVNSNHQPFCAFFDHKPKIYFNNAKTNRIFNCDRYRQKPNTILSCNPCQTCQTCTYKNEYKKEETTKNTPETLSSQSISGLKNSIYALLWLTGCKYQFGTEIVTYPKKKITFATLTLPSEQRHPDTFLKKQCLDQFFIELRKKNPDLIYIWRSEKQVNGNCHFHIILNKFYDYLTLNATWNRITDKHDYVKEYTRKFSRMNLHDYISNCQWNDNATYQNLLRRYRKGVEEQWKNPNSTDIDFIKKVNNVPGYLSKEMTKKNNNGGPAIGESKWKFPASGKSWSCSQLLSEKQAFTGHIPLTIQNELTKLHHIAKDLEWHNNYITHYSLSPDQFLKYNLKNCFDFYMNFLHS